MKSTLVKQIFVAIGLLGLMVNFASARPFSEKAPLFSEISVGQEIRVSQGEYGSTFNGVRGGEFKINFLNNDQPGSTGNWDFISFCLEYDEYLDYGTTFTVETPVGDVAYGGGVNVPSKTGDPVAQETKWVFWHYLQGTFAGFFTDNNAGNALANAVQYTIWYLEGEIADSFRTDIWKNFYDTKVVNAGDYSISGQVGVLNLLYPSGKQAQSQLIAQPVPEPATLMLFGFGLAGLAGLVRSRQNQQA